MLEQKAPNLWNYTRLLVILLLLAICCSVFWATTYYFSRFQQPNFPFHMWKKDIAVAQISCACTPTLYCMGRNLLCPFTMYLYIYYVSIHLSDGLWPSDKGTFHFGFLSVVRLGTDSFQQFNTDHFSTVITENRKKS